MLGFTGLLLVFLFLFQVVFLDDFYESVKIRQTKSTAKEVMSSIEDGNTAAVVSNKTASSDYCIRVGYVNDGKYSYLQQDAKNKGLCGYLGDNIGELYWEAKENGGTILKFKDIFEIKDDAEYINGFDVPLKSDGSTMEIEHTKDAPRALTYGLIEKINDIEYFVLVDTKVTIVSETASTIYIQLMIIMSILVLLALISGFIISNHIAKPIIQTNTSAKKLAEGDFAVNFDGKGYLEIEELNDTLNYARHELSKVEKLRNELIANMSHDLRTPLTMIAGYGEVMRDIPGENTPENVQVIIDECHRLTTLVNDILDLSKIQSKVQSLDKKVFNISLLINEILNRFTILLKKDEYDISFEYDEDVYVFADEVKMNQVIYNLLVNAVHYTGEDHKVSVRQIVRDDKVRIEISDTGEGIPKEDIAYIWDRYYKLDKTHRRTQVGSGLGLSIVKGILELHEAHYGVTSTLNEGTTFYFELKKVDSAADYENNFSI